jgi:hypothetical protein
MRELYRLTVPSYRLPWKKYSQPYALAPRMFQVASRTVNVPKGW